MKYRKKPIVIEAMQLTEKNFDPNILDFVGERTNYPNCKIAGIDPEDGYFKIKTLEGVMQGRIGDWIIKGINGEFYPCKPDIFEKTYEYVEEIPNCDPIYCQSCKSIISPESNFCDHCGHKIDKEKEKPKF